MAHRPDFTPGTAWGYSSVGCILVDMIVERVTGNPWWTEVERRIVRPLGLTATTWPGRSPEVPRPATSTRSSGRCSAGGCCGRPSSPR